MKNTKRSEAKKSSMPSANTEPDCIVLTDIVRNDLDDPPIDEGSETIELAQITTDDIVEVEITPEEREEDDDFSFDDQKYVIPVDDLSNDNLNDNLMGYQENFNADDEPDVALLTEEIVEETKSMGADLLPETALIPKEEKDVKVICREPTTQEIERALERVITKLYEEKIESLLVKLTEKKVSLEINKIRNTILEDSQNKIKS